MPTANNSVARTPIVREAVTARWRSRYRVGRMNDSERYARAWRDLRLRSKVFRVASWIWMPVGIAGAIALDAFITVPLLSFFSFLAIVFWAQGVRCPRCGALFGGYSAQRTVPSQCANCGLPRDTGN